MSDFPLLHLKNMVIKGEKKRKRGTIQFCNSSAHSYESDIGVIYHPSSDKLGIYYGPVSHTVQYIM